MGRWRTEAMNKQKLQKILDRCFYDQQAQHDIEDMIDLEKFAERLVKECVKEIHVADVGDLKGKSYYLDKVAEHIERYFEIMGGADGC